MESEIFDQPDGMDVVFNYIDLSFQLLPATSDEAYKKHAKYLHTLLRYYDKKASLNMSHSEKIIDVFGYCIRKDPYLAKYLDQQIDGMVLTKTRTLKQLKLELLLCHNRHCKLVSKFPAVSKLEITLDKLKGDGQIYWQSLWIGKLLVLPTHSVI